MMERIAPTAEPRRPGVQVLLTLLLLSAGVLFLAGCNTMEGLGRDTQAAGEAIEDTAEDAGD